ncbi:type II toxin-antitoxin system RelB/DinJ family antitoxin [Finegoldia magna]|uniref:type II toxin-antitoxin system RelB/DinJ family antitoxin n=1 Tax=Finegoldia magna TaxID=1260 RepID=UPI0026F14A73|nr:type II toxin-antitoxin system RelB/DinJ family antitoxin [Finegoldia magna]MBS5942816.1 type II toxin-antitoxin system RelB/DinJ family antitoxin [Finegoldia magna]MDU1580293.1 type II toxin-antitoxin system RelB/DinJ family antitoxin [Finegoldia magna]MDU1601167.1 type II toxin-antitoxin system RelB/DinJ family antitoxin [Finegoldia magna]
MSTVNLNIRTDKEIKEKAENIFQELGLNMTTAINMFLRTSIRENGIPFDLKIDSVNDETKLAIEEGRKIADDKTIEGYVSIEELKKGLENLR